MSKHYLKNKDKYINIWNNKYNKIKSQINVKTWIK